MGAGEATGNGGAVYGLVAEKGGSEGLVLVLIN